jgi:hypothetical protein
MKIYKINFDNPQKLEYSNIKPLMGIVGLYFIFLRKTEINYPFGKSRLIYIGMSEKKTNSIGKRLREHLEGRSGNIGLKNYKQKEDLYFTYLNFELLRKIWRFKIEDLESYFILDFVNQYGSYPICNNKTVFEIQNKEFDFKLDIDWKYFESKEGQNEYN